MFRIVSALLIAAVLAGCGRKDLPELTLEQIPPALQQAFANAKNSLIRKNADSIAMLVTEKQLVAASLQLQALSANTDLTHEQRNIVGAAMITVNRALQELAESVAANPENLPTETQSSAPPAKQEEAAAAAALMQHYIQTK